MQDDRINSLLLLGQDYGEYGDVYSVRVGPKAAASISVGSDEHSPSLAFKHDPTVKNEDVLFVVESGNRVAFAVADAHFGPESSHVLMSRIVDSLKVEVPKMPAELESCVRSMGEKLSKPATRSETTLAVAVYDRQANQVFGISVGDSTVMVVGSDRSTRTLNRRNQHYVSASTVSTSSGWNRFEFGVTPGDVLLAFTDGIDECHYRNPATSIQESDISEVVADAGFDPFKIVDCLTTLALSGVRSNPGGQDNVAVVAVTAS